MAPLYQTTRRMLVLCILMSLVALAACPAVFAQITVTNATFPVAGTTLRMAAASNRALGYSVMTAPGGGQVWDLSGLQLEALRNTTFQPANLGAAAVPGAELFAALAPFQEEYYNVTPTMFELQAYYGAPYMKNPRIVNTNPPLPMRHAPMNFFDLNVYNSTTTDVFATSELDSILRIRLEIPSTVDSLRYIEDLRQLDVVDAWGSLSIPGGTYNVLRLKRTLYRIGSLQGKVASIEWLPMQNIIGTRENLYGNSFPGIPIDTITSYHFFNDLEKEPIAVVSLRQTNGIPQAITQVMYKVNCVLPATSAISGTSSACPNQTGMGYSVTNTIGSTYAWTISGGTQASGTNTSSITVNWGAAGPGMVSVVETNAGLCVGAAVNLPVTVATAAGSICESKQSGDWNDPVTWVCGRVPVLCDKVTIRGPHVVSLSQSVRVAGLEMKDNGRLSLVGGNVQIGNL